MPIPEIIKSIDRLMKNSNVITMSGSERNKTPAAVKEALQSLGYLK